MIYIIIALLVLNFIFDKQLYSSFKIKEKSWFVLLFCWGLTLLVTFFDYRGDSYFGLSVLIFGIFIRNWGKFTLGRNFKYEVRKPKQLINKGIYSMIRHPMYTGYLLMWLGTVLALQSVYGLLLFLLLTIPALIYRIKVEEELLMKSFGKKYHNYMKRTYRLLPFIY